MVGVLLMALVGGLAGAVGWVTVAPAPEVFASEGFLLVRATETSSRGPILGSDRSRALVATIRGVVESSTVRTQANAASDLPLGVRPPVIVEQGPTPLLIRVRTESPRPDVDVRQRVDDHLGAAMTVLRDVTGSEPAALGVQRLDASPAASVPGGRDLREGAIALFAGATAGAAAALLLGRLFERAAGARAGGRWPLVALDALPRLVESWRREGTSAVLVYAPDAVAVARVGEFVPAGVRIHAVEMIDPSGPPHVDEGRRVLAVSAADRSATVDRLVRHVSPAALVVLEP